MCGITGMISEKPFFVRKELLGSIKRLEYRGYDSCGYATLDGTLMKQIGGIETLLDQVPETEKTSLGIAHTRWATHGGVTSLNSHPHHDQDKTIFCVHNGIIENFSAMKEQLKGYEFITDTDSEIIPHFIHSKLKAGKTIKQAIVDFMHEAEGTFAILLFIKGKDRIYALKRDSPLALGIAKGMMILGSDIYAFAKETQKAIFFDDDEFAEIRSDGYEFYDKKGTKIRKEVKEFKVSIEEESKEIYDHYMIKEILEQPKTSQRLIDSFRVFQKEKVNELVGLIRNSKRVMFLSCGTSYHASLVGVYMLRSVGIRAHTVIASEFDNYLQPDKETLIIAISQSGETMDVVSPLKEIKKKGIKIASIVNVPHSTIQRWSNCSIEILAGQEVSVASTKAFTNQVITLMRIAIQLGYKGTLDNISLQIRQTIDSATGKVKELAKEIAQHKDIFVLGKGASYPLAREIALKLKEICYIHAEGMMAGELKHGTIALIEKGTPVISLIHNNDFDMVSSTKEVEARGARTIIISNNPKYGEIIVPESCQAEFAIYAGIIGHLLSYYIADILGREIDKPRNLAKSVTVR